MNWTQEAQEKDDYLWSSLVNTYDDNSEAETDDGDNISDEEDERSRLSGLTFNCCIQQKDITNDTNLLNYSPWGE